MQKQFLGLAVATALSGMTSLTSAATLYSENFDVDASANWSFNSSVASDAGNNNTANEWDGFFNYSLSGIPSAPNSTGGTTRGLKLEANVAGATFSGVSASPIGQSFTGDYIMRADVWQQFNGPFPGGGNGSTQIAWAGIGTDGTTTQFPGTSVQGVGFGATADGGSTQDYRAYTNVGAPLTAASGSYSAGTFDSTSAGDAALDSRNANHAYYSSFGSKTAPPAQLTLFPGQTGTTAAGTQGMAWHDWEIKKVGNTVTWRIDGVLISTVDVTSEPFGGNNLFLGYFDVNATSSSDANEELLLYGLFDNIRVETVPEPTGLAMLGLGAVALAGRYRRRR